MFSEETIRRKLGADRAWWAAVREHFLRNLASCDEGEWALLQHADMRLSELDKAIRRLDSGQYGICERCGAHIAPDRLEALPDSGLCLACAMRQASAQDVVLRVGACR